MKLRRYVVTGFVAAVVIALTSAMRGWPFPNLTAEPWLFQLSTNSRAERYAFLVMFYGAVGALSWSWFKLCQASRQKAVSVRQTFLIFLFWSVPILFATPLFSGDVYVYWVDGQLMARGFNPYVSGVSAMGPVPMVHIIHPLWRGTSTAYGPLFMRIAQGVATVTPNSATDGVLVYRGLAVGSILLMGVSLRAMLARMQRPVAEGLVFALLNPITLLHLVGGAHNDAMMMGFLCSGLALGICSKSWPLRLVALFLCSASGAFKIPGFASVLVLGWIWAGVDVSRIRRTVGAAVAGALGLVAFEAQTLITGLGWGWLNAVSVPGLAHPLLAPANALAFSFGSVFGGGGLAANGITRTLAELLAVIVGATLLIRTGRRATPETSVRAFAWGLLAIAWAGPAVYPWYLAWGVALAGAVGLNSMRKPLMFGTIGVIFLVAPGGYGFLDLFTDWRRTVTAFVVMGVFVGLARYLYKRAHAAGYLPASGPNWNAYSNAVKASPSLISPSRIKVRS